MVCRLEWDATVTISSYNNKIVKLNNLALFHPPAMSLVRNQVGHPTSSFYGYKIIGIFKDAEEVASAPVQDAAKPGRFRYMDVNNDKRISERTGCLLEMQILISRRDQYRYQL